MFNVQRTSCRYGRMNMHRLCVAAFLPVLVALAGCSRSGPTRFDLSGTVTYDGKPVPVGFIVLNPDVAGGRGLGSSAKSAGNPGPGAQADIRDGKYQTRLGQGTIGGPHVASIFGFDGKPYETAKDPQGNPITNPMGKPLFKTAAIKADLPKQTSVFDFVVPKQ
jgi:hypothetical protein